MSGFAFKYLFALDRGCNGDGTIDFVRKDSPTTCGVVVVATAQLHLTKSELKFCADIDLDCVTCGFCDGESL